MKIITSLFAVALLSLITASLATQRFAEAESYPTRPVKVIQPYPAGGPGDVIARVLVQKLSEQTGGQFYVEKLPGAGGTICAGIASKVPSVGYTYLMIYHTLVVMSI